VTKTKVFERTPRDSAAPALAEQLKSYLPIVVQGGLSSMSECAALGKYMFIVPVTQHWEQFLNAQEAEHLGLAKQVQVADLDLAINEFYKTPQAALLPNVDCTGAQVICDSLLEEGFHEV
jgi:predicted glycosyltransferase